ncbi:hypothetical protein F4680DRAFT_452039 [Xylaria scruposa]|nr:hypothetical protein F4680DRAFT_452039 [Xylaria scruposa]
MVCQTRSKAKRQAEQQNTRQTRKRNVLGAARATKKRTRKLTSFNRLPTEIRLMIWEEFVRTPRIIHIDFLSRPTEATRGYTCRFESIRWRQTKSEQVCPLLGVSRESRYVALKEPFIHFGIEYPALQRTQFRSDNLIARTFSIRSRDIVFFDNSESLPSQYFWGQGNAANIANVMIGLDVSLINYKNLDAIPSWLQVFKSGWCLTYERLHTKECLQRIYCLLRDSSNTTTDKLQHCSLDSIRELTPEMLSNFPGRKKDLTRWLEEYDTFPSSNDRSVFFTTAEIIAFKKLWKNHLPRLRLLHPTSKMEKISDKIAGHLVEKRDELSNFKNELRGAVEVLKQLLDGMDKGTQQILVSSSNAVRQYRGQPNTVDDFQQLVKNQEIIIDKLEHDILSTKQELQELGKLFG